MDVKAHLAGIAQHIFHLAYWGVGVLGPVHDAHHNLVARFTALETVKRNEYVGSQELGVAHEHCIVLLHMQRAHKHLFLAFDNLNNLGFGFHAVSCGADVHHHLVTVEGVHRVALGHHDGVAVLAAYVHAVLAVAAAYEAALGHHRTVSSLETACIHLNEESVHSQLFQYIDDESTLLGGSRAHRARNLLVIERGVLAGVVEVDHSVMKLATLNLQ